MRNEFETGSLLAAGLRRCWVALAFAGAAAAASAAAIESGSKWLQPTGEPGLPQVRLLADEAVAEDEFGFTVAIDGNTAVVGARLADIGDEVNRGAAYVFVRDEDGWTQQARLLASDGAFAQLFGQSVAIDGDTILVGAIGARVDGVRRGAAYVFTRTGSVWEERAKLIADDGGSFDDFGSAVALDGDTALIGASAAHVGSNNVQGTAYVFVRDGENWQQQAKLLAADGASFSAFGNAVALSGDSAVIGAHQASVPDGFWQGTAYVFERNGGLWSQHTKLVAAESQAFDQFGHSVAIDGDTLLVGSQAANEEQGAAYVFVRDAGVWNQQATLTAADGAPGDRFASALAVHGDRAIVGADLQGAIIGVNLDRGAAYRFQRVGGQWSEEEKLMAANPAIGDRFGAAVALDGERYLVGAPGIDADSLVDRGAAFVFGADKPQPPSAPRLTLDPEQVEVSLELGDVLSFPVQIGNAGTDLDLEWSVVDAVPTVDQVRLPLRSRSQRSSRLPDRSVNAAARGTTTITHSLSTEILPKNSVACADNATGFTRVNRFLRVFELADFGLEHGLEVSEVMFGVQRLEPAADIVVNLYTVEGALSFVNFTRLATQTVSLSPQQGTLVTVPIQASVPAGSILVMEVVPPDMAGLSGAYFPGSNNAGQTAPSYTAAPSCGAPDPVTFESIGFPDLHLVMTVSGQAQAEPQCASPAWFDVSSNGGVVTALSAQTIELGFNADLAGPGEHHTDLCLVSNDPQRPFALVPVTLGIAAAPVGELEVDPAQIDFGAVPAGISAGPASVSLRNSGSAPVSVTSLAAPAAPFARVGGDCPAAPFTLDADSSCTLLYRFQPTQVGDFEQSLAIESDANPVSIGLRGTGIAAVPAQLIRISGSDQSATVHTTFAEALVVQVRDAHNNPVPGISVEFAGPSTGAGAVLPSTPPLTDAQGIAHVTAQANGVVGSYAVAASIGIGAPVQFDLSNVAASADIAVSLIALRDHVQNGALLNQVLSVHNLGPDPATGVDVASALSAELDLQAGAWLCLGPGSSGCTDQGSGELVDTGLLIPHGGTVSYLLTTPVRSDADGPIVSAAHADYAGDPDPGNNSAQAQVEIVLFRDGFEPYGAGASHPLDEPFDAQAELLLRWPEAGVDGLVSVLTAEAIGEGPDFRIEALTEYGRNWLRLVRIDANAERPGAWLPVAVGSVVAVTLQSGTPDGDGGSVLLIGATDIRRMPLSNAAASYQVRLRPDLLSGGTDPE